jgi:hypothetical protein
MRPRAELEVVVVEEEEEEEEEEEGREGGVRAGWKKAPPAPVICKRMRIFGNVAETAC